MAEKEIVYNGISFSGLLFITFLVMKLTNVISWSWWWVFAPFWVPFAIGIGAIVIWGIIVGLVKTFL